MEYYYNYCMLVVELEQNLQVVFNTFDNFDSAFSHKFVDYPSQHSQVYHIEVAVFVGVSNYNFDQ